ncbi:GDP-L-fucose synthase [bacterium]|nr:GDP-L-fucose synthase [bacterium]
MNKDSKIYIAGHSGMVGSAVVRKLREESFSNLILKTRKQLDLTNQQLVKSFYKEHQPEYVFICAAKVGGIHANNTYRADFLYENIQIQNNLIHYAYKYGVKKLLFLGSSCIYPRDCRQPIKEEYLLTGLLEETNEPYAVAKIAGIKMCESYNKQYGSNFISIMPTNLYGLNDNYDLMTGHVFAAFIRKFHEAKIFDKAEVVCWGTGEPLREFLFSSDLASALVFLMQNYSGEKIINVGSNFEITIYELAKMVKDVIGFTGRISWDASKPNGTRRKLMDSSRLFAMGWRPKIELKQGIALAYADFLERFPS